jgi:hypothetical protein|tara:strand:- start:295 stop:513 length:219 start_codon:yes stop_codon:yes gene_type:complete
MGTKFRLKISKKYSKYLENLPEQGMGYKLIDVELKNGLKLINRIVINSNLLELKTKEEFWNKDIKELKIKLK